MGTATKILGIIAGIIIIFFGLVVFLASMMMPVLFAGQYIFLALVIFIIGGVVIWLGMRSGKKSPTTTVYPSDGRVNSIRCNTCEGINSVGSKFCRNCGISM